MLEAMAMHQIEIIYSGILGFGENCLIAIGANHWQQDPDRVSLLEDLPLILGGFKCLQN
jgi:hypothetical protein